MKEKIQTFLGYSNYEMAILKYLFLTLFSELSKLIIYYTFWRYQNKEREFLFCFTLFILLRTCSGGLHFHNYFSCFLCSLIYFILCINILPMIFFTKLFKLLLLFVSVIVTYEYTPVVSQYRKQPSRIRKQKAKLQLFLIIFIYFIAMYIMQPYPILDIGFWCIILHTIQLYVAHILIERRKKNAE